MFFLFSAFSTLPPLTRDAPLPRFNLLPVPQPIKNQSNSGSCESPSDSSCASPLGDSANLPELRYNRFPRGNKMSHNDIFP